MSDEPKHGKNQSFFDDEYVWVGIAIITMLLMIFR